MPEAGSARTRISLNCITAIYSCGYKPRRSASPKPSQISPCILCLSEQEPLTGAQLSDARADEVCFRPEVINPTFDIQTLHKKMGELDHTQGLDTYWLFPFLHSSGPLLRTIDQELTEQQGDFWPCRSRAVFYELLDLIARIDSERGRSVSADVPHNPIELLAAQALDPDFRTHAALRY
mgnify:CR=1 FL=1